MVFSGDAIGVCPRHYRWPGAIRSDRAKNSGPMPWQQLHDGARQWRMPNIRWRGLGGELVALRANSPRSCRGARQAVVRPKKAARSSEAGALRFSSRVARHLGRPRRAHLWAGTQGARRDAIARLHGTNATRQPAVARGSGGGVPAAGGCRHADRRLPVGARGDRSAARLGHSVAGAGTGDGGMSGQLVRYDAMCHAIAAAYSVDEFVV